MVIFETSLGGGDYNSIKKRALEFEKEGLDSICYSDHFWSETKGFERNPYLECWTTLTALAVETKKIRLATHVLCNLYRHPPLLAKMSASLDVISGGRFELGIGTCWQGPEYIAYGYPLPFPDPVTRIEQLREAVQIIKKMWTEDYATFEGKHYRIKNAINYPKPIQKPHPPIRIGTRKGVKILRVVAELADVWMCGRCPPEEYKYYLDKLVKHCNKVGRNPKKIRNAYWTGVIIAENKKELRKEIKKIKKPVAYSHMSMEEYLNMNIVGTPKECVKKIQKFIDLGVTHFTLFGNKLFREQVIPILK